MSKIKYYLKDSLELLKEIPDNSIDFILTDPPYELDNHGGRNKDGYFKRKLTNEKHINYISDGFDYDNTFKEYERVLKVMNMVIFCSNKQVSKIMSYWEQKGYSTTLLVWEKPNPIPLGNGKYISNIEFMIYVRGKNATFNNIGFKEQLKTFKYKSPNSSDRLHPTEKPVKLLRRLLKIHTNENDTVLDTFAGSFSTGVACFYENRNAILCENDKEMFEKAKNIIDNITSQKKIF